MDKINDPNELDRRLKRMAIMGVLPASIAERVELLPGSQADRIMEGAEILYAHYDELNDAARELTGQLFGYFVDQEFTTFNGGPRGTGNRSEQIVALARRDLGEKGTGVARKADTYPEPQVMRRDGTDWRKPEEKHTPAEAPTEPS